MAEKITRGIKFQPDQESIKTERTLNLDRRESKWQAKGTQRRESKWQPKSYQRRESKWFARGPSAMSITSGVSFESQASYPDSIAGYRVSRKSRKSMTSSLSHRFTKKGFISIERQPSLRYKPSYRLKSNYPFNPEFVHSMLRFHLERNFEGYTYNPKTADKKCQRVTINLLTRVKQLHYDRYRLACVVLIGEKYFQGCKFVTGFLWDKSQDMWAHHVHETTDYYVVAIVYGIYYD